MKKNNFIDLFAGCGGLMDGFMQSNKYNHIASVEWEEKPVLTLRKRLKDKWLEENVEKSVIKFDMQRTAELINGFDDEKYGQHCGLDSLLGNDKLDFIIGGPPCQAYSVAGRISDKNNMKDDYRNYLFEYYLKLVNHYQPSFFVFENVPGMLSAMPDGTKIIDLIKRDIAKIGFEVINDVSKYAILNASDFGVPQNRKRVILVGVNKSKYPNKDIQQLLKEFYLKIIPRYHKDKISVQDAIGDMPKCLPLKKTETLIGRKHSHSIPNCPYTWHVARFVSERDMPIYKKLTEDLETGKNEYADSKKLCELYNNLTGASTKVHKYHVLKPDLPSTTILAHLYKDGLRFIHYDSKQLRSITPRESARLQSFDDDFDFVGTQGDVFKMIGNAVPPKMAKVIALALDELKIFMEEK